MLENVLHARNRMREREYVEILKKLEGEHQDTRKRQHKKWVNGET